MPVFTLADGLLALFGGVALCAALAMLLVRERGRGSVAAFFFFGASNAAILVLLEAHLLAVIQLGVAAGVAIVFVVASVLLLDEAHEGAVEKRERSWRSRARSAGALVVVAAAVGVWVGLALFFDREAPLPAGFGGLPSLGASLFGDYLVPVELVSLVFLTAVVGAVMLAARKVD